MLAFLAGVPGKLKTILDRLTATRAANLDDLDVAVSTRMPGSATEQGRIDVAISTRAAASTALSTVNWTTVRAGKLDNLDNLDAAISTRAPASTALSTAVWTGTIAGRIDADISSRAAAATALTNATWTDARAAKLDSLPVVDGVSDSPPIAADWGDGTANSTSGELGTLTTLNIAAAVGGESYLTVSTTYVDIVNITGSGMLQFLIFTGSAANGAVITLTIDGVDIVTDLTSTNAINNFRVLAGIFYNKTEGLVMGFSNLPFKSSLRIQAKTVSGSHAGVYKLYRTA